MNSVVKQQQLDWRRAQVLELTSEGYNQREIANKLQVDAAAVNRDMQFLRQQAQENIQRHIHETIPEEYQRCMTGMKRNLKQILEIANTTADPRLKLQARAIANDCFKNIMELTTDGVVVSDAMKYVEDRKQKLTEAIKKQEQGREQEQNQEAETEMETETEAETHNGIF
jgi:hypothetical protein